MKRAFFLSFLLFTGVACSLAQGKLEFPPDNDLAPAAYAAQATNIFELALHLSKSQTDLVYNAVFRKKSIQDSLTRYGVHLDEPARWAIYTLLDGQFKAILSEQQYFDYEQMKDKKFYSISMKQKQ